MLKTRVLTAVIGLPIVVWLLVWGEPILVAGALAVFVFLCAHEAFSILWPKLSTTFGMAGLERVIVQKLGLRGGAIAVAVFSALAFLAVVFFPPHAARAYLGASLLATVMAGAFATRTPESAMGAVVGYLVPVAYCTIPWFAVWDLYRAGPASCYVLLVLAIVWTGDTAGYFGGRSFGKRRMAPTISPKKSWEGAFCSLLASIGAALLVNFLYKGALGPWPVLLLAGAFGNVFGQLGDLVESMFKRYAGVKDSGALLPGHGGVLDRVDAVLFGAPVVWLILNVFGLA